jgi:hypothetical protein
MKHENIASTYKLPLMEIIKSGCDEKKPNINIKHYLITGNGYYSKKSCQHFKLHPLLSRLHLNLITPLRGNNPWSIFAFNVFYFLDTI